MTAGERTTRDRLLDAFETLLVTAGSRAATLDAVAAQAEVSKGGLLYHFKNKQALYAGLLDWSKTEVSRSMSDRVQRQSAARAYLEYSLPESEVEAASTSALIAAVRADDAVGPDAAAELVELFHRWDAPLLDEVQDPALAQTIRLVGLGLYLGAVAGLPTPEPGVLGEVMLRLIAAADADAAQR